MQKRKPKRSRKVVKFRTQNKTESTPGQFRQTNRTQPEQRGKSTLNRIGALWIGEGRNGRFMSGRIELNEGQEIRVLVFKNGFKEQDNHPDYLIYEPETRRETSNRTNAAKDWKGGKGRADYDDSDIPF